MIFYHFTSAKFIDRIKKEGLTEGRTPYIDSTGFINFHNKHQWLTREKDPELQKWASVSHLPFSRLEYRLKINIPVSHMQHIVTMAKMEEWLKGKMIPGFNAFPEETKDWVCYKGVIYRAWIERYTRIDGL